MISGPLATLLYKCVCVLQAEVCDRYFINEGLSSEQYFHSSLCLLICVVKLPLVFSKHTRGLQTFCVAIREWSEQMPITFLLPRKLSTKLKALIFKYLNDMVFFSIVTIIIARTASGTVSVIPGKSQSRISTIRCRDKKILACITRPMHSK